MKEMLLCYVAITSIALLYMSEKQISASLSEKDKVLYETYIETEYADSDYLYTYFDYDTDGKKELYLRDNQTTDSYGYIYTTNYGGLIRVDSGIVPQIYLDSLDWTETKPVCRDTAVTGERTHQGIWAYISQHPYESRNIWYPDKQTFLSQYGFSDSTPFYEYVMPDGSLRLSFYYDARTKRGCGLRYYERDSSDIITSGAYGFSFQGIEKKTWNGFDADYTKFESPDGYTASYLDEYQENIEYDSAGNVTHYESSGIIEEDEEPSTLLQIDYDYYEDGTLKQRIYYHNSRQFATSYMYWKSYFDELSRLEYEDIYITHGSIDDYYIYLDESSKPSYHLSLDNNLGSWIPVLIQY